MSTYFQRLLTDNYKNARVTGQKLKMIMLKNEIVFSITYLFFMSGTADKCIIWITISSVNNKFIK